ncbi:MAG: hypothetical protein WC632_03625 [Candidatus Margulisiibacteriota bacterium]
MYLLRFLLLVCLLLLVIAPAKALYPQAIDPAKKVVQPPIAPLEPLQPADGTTFSPAPLPPAPISNEADPLAQPKGLFNWGRNGEINSAAMLGNGWYLTAGSALAFEDPWRLGEKFGLAEDSIVYKAGLTFGFGNTPGKVFFSLLQGVGETTVYLKEGSLFGLDPFIGAAFMLNLSGTDNSSGGLGWRLFGGAAMDLAFGLGRAEVAAGYETDRSGRTHAAEGLFFAVRKPIRL